MTCEHPQDRSRPRGIVSAMKHFGAAVGTVAALACTTFSGCSSSALPYMQNGAPVRELSGTGAGKIKHIVYIVQENRSFNDLFNGYPGAYTVKKGQVSDGSTVPLQPEPLSDQYVIDHSFESMVKACNGTGTEPGTKCRMNGFDQEPHYGGPLNYPEYVYVPHSDSKPYFDMAHEGVLADKMFQSQLDESFVAHQYVIAAQAAWSVDLPSGAWGCSGGTYDSVEIIGPGRRIEKQTQPPCYDYTTLGDELDTAKLTWRFYAARYGSESSGDGAVWSSYQAVKHIYEGPDWHKDVISPNWRFITDVRAGRMANFTWITPVCDDSDHVNCPGGYGPSWVAALVNAVGNSKFWDSTAIFIQWDDWGGLYDPVAPPPPYDRDSLGFRVPLLILSPYAKHDFVSHTQYETASVLRFAEDLWGLPQMAPADKRAASPAADCFDFNQPPAKWVDIKAPLPARFFMHQGDAANYFAPDYE
jgi:phospholipase C